jgi:hypothetical protein
MRANRMIRGLGLCLLLLFVAEQANAHAWCATRNKCRWWAKKFTANTRVGCIGLPLPLCAQYSANCNWTANLSCGWRHCIVGGGNAAASNGWNGCWTWTSRTGIGIAGDSGTTAREDDAGGHDVYSRAEFDDLTRTVTITLDQGEISAKAGGMAGRLDVYVLWEDPTEPTDPDTEAPDPEPTPENTYWHGSVVLRDGQVTVTGFDPAAFRVTTDSEEVSRVHFQNVTTVQQFDISDEDFGALLVKVVADEE